MAISGQNISFKYGLKANFDNLTPKDQNTVYFVQDSQGSSMGDLFVGNTKFGGINVQTSGSGEFITGIEYQGHTLTFTLGDATYDGSLKTVLDNLLANYVQGISAKTAANGGGAIEVNNADAQNPIINLKLDNSGNVNLSQGANGLKAEVNIPEAGIAGVSGNDKFLSINSGLLESNITVTYENGNINLWGTNTVVPVATIDLADAIEDALPEAISDGMISSASYADGTITLVFNTDGPTTPIEIDVSDLIDIYTGQNGITVSAANEVGIDNYVTPGNVNSDVTLAFGTSTAVRTAAFGTPGLITGTSTFNITLPTLPDFASPTGTVGGANKLISSVELGANGLSGTATYDVAATFPSTTAAMSTAIPTALAVENQIVAAVAQATVQWETFDPTSTPSV